jgi:RNA polymerase sigma-70 factor (ECF subfamily)
MKSEEFILCYAEPIAAVWGEVVHRYAITQQEFAERLYACAVRSLPGGLDGLNDAEEVTALLAHLKADDLCLAIACERGDENAWRDFETGYRVTMLAAARKLTRDEAEAEDLVQSVIGELYGVRGNEEQRQSKLTHYSGRGSLGGWLRAVIYQSFIDRRRQSSRFEQVEEATEFDRLPQRVDGPVSATIALPDEVEETRLRQATEEALAQAFASLEVRDRLLLNYYYFDGLTLCEIGALMGVHEATISRWLHRARRQVRHKTEDLLRRNYKLRRTEIAECLHLAASAEVDLRKMIGEAKGASVERAP